MSKQKNYFGHQHNWFYWHQIKIFATMKSIKFSITICINFVGKMLIWDHFCDIMELSLNKYLGYFLIIFLFIESAIKPRPLLHANIQILLRTECNWSNWWWPECFYEPESSVTTPKSGQPKLPIHNIHQSYGSMCIHAGLDKSEAHGRTWVLQKAYQQLHNYE